MPTYSCKIVWGGRCIATSPVVQQRQCVFVCCQQQPALHLPCKVSCGIGDCFLDVLSINLSIYTRKTEAYSQISCQIAWEVHCHIPFYPAAPVSPACWWRRRAVGTPWSVARCCCCAPWREWQNPTSGKNTSPACQGKTYNISSIGICRYMCYTYNIILQPRVLYILLLLYICLTKLFIYMFNLFIYLYCIHGVSSGDLWQAPSAATKYCQSNIDTRLQATLPCWNAFFCGVQFWSGLTRGPLTIKSLWLALFQV